MLRYFYLICLFICISSTHCKARSNRNFNSHKHGIDGEVKKISINDRQGLDQRYEHDYKSPVQLFDVASFVQRSNEDEEHEQPYGIRIKKGRFSNNYDYEIGMNYDNNKKREKGQDYQNIGSDNNSELKFNSALFKEAVNPRLNMNEISLDDKKTKIPGHNKIRNTYKDQIFDQIHNHNSVKKSVLKHNMKFPFFSHNKSTLKPKKHKRKLFCFNCPKSTKQPNGVVVKTVEDAPNIPMKVKRSDDDSPCLTCGKKHKRNVEDYRQKKSSVKIIHNSRQFYQNIDNFDKLGRNAKQFNPNKAGTPGDTVRNKREEIDRERQLKELEEVQKKIDSVKIHMPSFERRPPEAIE